MVEELSPRERELVRSSLPPSRLLPQSKSITSIQAVSQHHPFLIRQSAITIQQSRCGVAGHIRMDAVYVLYSRFIPAQQYVSRVMYGRDELYLSTNQGNPIS